MTENQRKAYDELNLYKEAKRNISHMKQKLDELEAKTQRATRACDSIMRETWRDGKFIAVPVVVQGGYGNGAEDLIDALMDQRVLYVQKQAEAERICMKIEVNIGNRVNGVEARFLRSYFLYNKRLEFIAVDEGYSYANIKRIKWRALEHYGEAMSPKDEPQ